MRFTKASNLSNLVLLLALACFGCGGVQEEPGWNKPAQAGAAPKGPLTSGIAAVLEKLPADMRDSLTTNELRRKRANEWLEKNVVGTPMQAECEVEEVNASAGPPGKYWVRIWIKPGEQKILGCNWIIGVGPGCRFSDVLFDRGLADVANVVSLSVIFGEHFNPRPDVALLETRESSRAEKLDDLRGKTVKLRGTIEKFMLFPEPSFGNVGAGGILIKLRDATLNNIPVMTDGPEEAQSYSLNPKNPFGHRFEAPPEGADVEELRKRANLPGGTDDQNAEAWSNVPKSDDGIDGLWQGRWKKGDGAWQQNTDTSRMQTKDGLHYFEYVDPWGKYLFVLKSEGDFLFGHYVNLSYPFSGPPAPFVGRVVSPSRIDGHWVNEKGEVRRWDFRRID